MNKSNQICHHTAGSGLKNLLGHAKRHKGHRFNPWVRKTPWRRKWHPAPVFLSGKSHGQKSLTGYSTRGGKELDTAECWCTRAHTHTHTHTDTHMKPPSSLKLSSHLSPIFGRLDSWMTVLACLQPLIGLPQLTIKEKPSLYKQIYSHTESQCLLMSDF